MKITSYKIACKTLGKETPKAPNVSHLPKKEKDFYIAIHEITTVIKAINKLSGFKVNWADDAQKKWRCWFERKLNAKGQFSGFVFVYSFYGWAYTCTFGGSRFALGSKEDADFVGEKFIKTWNKILVD